jgi:hypothetical protein
MLFVRKIELGEGMQQEYRFSCICGYDTRHSNKGYVMRDAERHSQKCSMAWDTDVQNIETMIE